MTRKKDVWDKLAEHTFARCLKKCKTGLGSCCSQEYCDEAARYMAEKKQTPPAPAGGRVRFLTPEGKCAISPRYRPLCTAHQCDICSMGWAADDPEWSKKYFELREKV